MDDVGSAFFAAMLAAADPVGRRREAHDFLIGGGAGVAGAAGAEGSASTAGDDCAAASAAPSFLSLDETGAASVADDVGVSSTEEAEGLIASGTASCDASLGASFNSAD